MADIIDFVGNEGFSVNSSFGMIMASCVAPAAACRLISTFRPMPKIAQVIHTPRDCDDDTNVVTIRPVGTVEQISEITPALQILAKNICEQCIKNKNKQRH